MSKDHDILRPQDLIGDPENPNTPAQMLQALISKAIDTGSLRPLGQALGGVQAQVDSVFGLFQSNLSRLGQVLSINTMQTDTVRMAFIALVDHLIEKNILTQEEWDKLYDEKVQKKMEERMEAARKRHEEAINKCQEQPPKESCEESCSCSCDQEPKSDIVLASEQEGAVKHFSADEEK